MIFTVIGVLILLYSLINYKKSLMIYIAFKLFLVTNITVLSIPGMPILTVEDFLNICFALVFLLDSHEKKERIRFPFKIPFFIMAFSTFLSAIFSIAGFYVDITSWIRVFFENYILVYIVWIKINNENDFKYIFKLITMVIFCSCIYGIIEYFMQTNPLILYEQTLINDSSKTVYATYEITAERGYRVQSIFEHCIGAGMCWGTYFFFCLSYIMNEKKKLPCSRIVKFTMILCVICLFLTKMRSGILFTMIASIGALDFKKKRTYIFCTISCFALFLFLNVFDIGEILSRIFTSLFTGNAMGGSSPNLRFRQLEVVLNLFSLSPIFGLGAKYTSVISHSLINGLYGSESIWFIVLPSYGLIGTFAWIIYYYFLIIKIPYYYRSKQLLFLSLAYVVTYSLTTIPGYKNILLFMCMMFFIKKSIKYKNEIQCNIFIKKNDTNISGR